MIANVITKLTPVVGTVQTLVSPGTPAIPARPAYSYPVVQSQTLYLYTSYYTTTDISGNVTTVGVLPLVPHVYTNTFYIYVPPQAAVPAVPATYISSPITSANLGWNGGGKSISVMQEGFEYGFTFGAGTINTYVGLNIGIDRSTNPLDILIAVNSTRGVTTLYYPGGSILLGLYDQFLFTRDQNNDIRLQYYNGASWAYVESSPSVTWVYNLSLPVFLDASIYAGGNSVELWRDVGYRYATASIAASGILKDSNLNSALTIKALATIRAGIGRNQVTKYLRSTIAAKATVTSTPHSALTLHSSISALATVLGTLMQGGDTTLPALFSLGTNRMYGSVQSTLPTLTSTIIASIPVPDVITSITELPIMAGIGHGYTGYIGSATTSLPFLTSLASNRWYGSSSINLPALTAYSGQIGAANEAYAVDGFNFAQLPTAQFLGTTGAAHTIQINATASSIKEIHESIYANINPNVNPVVILVADVSGISSISVVITEQTADNSDWGSWVVNYETNAHWRYDNYQFNSFATFNGVTYGCKDDGIYALTGSTDNGTAIDAKITTAVTDFDNSQKKHMLKSYLGVKSDGDLLLKVLAEGGNVYYYGVDKTRTSIGGTRVNIGRGLASRYWQFELLNVDGADFELDAIEFFPVITSRREM